MTNAIRLATKHVSKGTMASSAAVCLERAISWEQKDAMVSTYWATKSLAYSVGIFHADYATAKGC